MIEGYATAEGTSAFRDRAVRDRSLAPGHFRLAPDGLTVSSVGLGTYLGRPDAATDRAAESALEYAVRSGRVNVVDTAINYRHQRAERSVGRALARLVQEGAVRREEVLVATKVGYLAPDGESGLDPSDWLQSELVDRGVVAPADIVDGVHSMAPEYLSDQIHRSLANLGLETVDLVYLHNAAEAQMPIVGRTEFELRLRAAFDRLEEHRRRGELRNYGLATWDALRVPIRDAMHVALTELVDLATEVGGTDHGFRFVQLPFNRAMPEARDRACQRAGDRTLSPFAAAEELGVGAFSSVPLLQGQLAVGPSVGALSAAQGAIQFARSARGNLAALVGSTSVAHLTEDLAVAAIPPDRGGSRGG